MGAAQAKVAQSDEWRVPPLAAVEWCYLVGYRRPLTSLSPEQQEQIRASYAGTKWAVSDTDSDVTFLGVTTDLGIAIRKKNSLVGGFYVKLPANGFLSTDPGRETIQSHNGAEEFYESTSPGMCAVEHCERRTIETIARLTSETGATLQALVDS
jgi:hypothetical protein